MLNLLHIPFIMSFGINLIKFPFDRGANRVGSSLAPDFLETKLDFINFEKKIEIESLTRHVRTTLGDGYFKVWESLNQNKFPFILGGDHTIAVSSIFAVNEYCAMKNEKVGIIWSDAHGDFNTIQDSITKNLHGTPVAILCGDTLPLLQFGKYLEPEQFCYYGVRDLDIEEEYRMNYFDMKMVEENNEHEIQDFIDKFDKIHLSFDIDCIDSKLMKCVNTPVANGPSIENIKKVLKTIKNSNKLMSMDLVEYNPKKGDNSDVVVNLMKELF
jgi:arginase